MKCHVGHILVPCFQNKGPKLPKFLFRQNILILKFFPKNLLKSFLIETQKNDGTRSLYLGYYKILALLWRSCPKLLKFDKKLKCQNKLDYHVKQFDKSFSDLNYKLVHNKRGASYFLNAELDHSGPIFGDIVINWRKKNKIAEISRLSFPSLYKTCGKKTIVCSRSRTVSDNWPGSFSIPVEVRESYWKYIQCIGLQIDKIFNEDGIPKTFRRKTFQETLKPKSKCTISIICFFFVKKTIQTLSDHYAKSLCDRHESCQNV